MDINTIFLIVAGLVVVGGYIWYTRIISNKNKVKEALSGIDVQLQKRGELVPNILKIAKKFLEHEKELMTEITRLRSEALKDYDKGSQEEVKNHLDIAKQLGGKMGQLMVAVENYPDLKSDQSMNQAMLTYNEVEAQIAAARRFYNAAVNALNNSVEIFPGNIIAGIANVKVMPFYEAPEETKAPVDAGDYLS